MQNHYIYFIFSFLFIIFFQMEFLMNASMNAWMFRWTHMLILTQLASGQCGMMCVRLYGVWCTHSFKSQDFLLFLSALRWLGCGHINSSLDMVISVLFFFLHFSFHFYLSTFGGSSNSVNNRTLSLCEERKNHQTNKQNRTPYTYPFMNFTHR